MEEKKVILKYYYILYRNKYFILKLETILMC